MADTVSNMDKLKALEIASGHGGSPGDVVERAKIYHGFLTGAATPAASGTAANKTTAPATSAASGTAGNKPAAAGGKPAAGPKPAPAGGKPAPTGKPAAQPKADKPKLPNGQYTAEQVKDKMREVLQTPGLGRDLVKSILDEECNGAKGFGDVKPEQYDGLYEAFQNALTSGEGETGQQVETADDDLGV